MLFPETTDTRSQYSSSPLAMSASLISARSSHLLHWPVSCPAAFTHWTPPCLLRQPSAYLKVVFFTSPCPKLISKPHGAKYHTGSSSNAQYAI